MQSQRISNWVKDLTLSITPNGDIIVKNNTNRKQMLIKGSTIIKAMGNDSLKKKKGIELAKAFVFNNKLIFGDLGLKGLRDTNKRHFILHLVNLRNKLKEVLEIDSYDDLKAYKSLL